jgi:hypothetical protein
MLSPRIFIARASSDQILNQPGKIILTLADSLGQKPFCCVAKARFCWLAE